DLDELRRRLAAAATATDGTDADPWGLTPEPATPETVGRWITERRLTDLATHWAAGGELDWTGLWPAGRPRRVSLPTYPFVRERHWVPVPAGVDGPGRTADERPAAPAAGRGVAPPAGLLLT